MNSQPHFSTKNIEYLERDYIDALEGRLDAASMAIERISDACFLKVDAIASFWDLYTEKVTSLRSFMEDILSGLCENKIPLLFAIIGKKDRIQFLFGTFGTDSRRSAFENLAVIKTALKSSFPGIEYRDIGWQDVDADLSCLSFSGLVVGTPTEKVGTEKIGVEQIERLIRGLYGREWGYLVAAVPASAAEIGGLYNSTLNESRMVIDFEKSLGRESPICSQYKELLQFCRRKLMLCKTMGMWHASVSLFSKDGETLSHARALARSVFGGKESLPDPIRTIELTGRQERFILPTDRPPAPPGQFSYPYAFMNTLNSSDLSDFVHLSSQEMPGFRIKPYARFNVSTGSCSGDMIPVGNVLDQSSDTGTVYQVSRSSLKKHGLIVGTTGSGKTNTLFYLLKEMWRQHIPFLVIEPVKTEYRRLLHSADMGGEVRVYTLGNNKLSPFRINPLEIAPGIPVQTHIDLLKSVFNASFYMWGPLPHVLERCIHEVYIDKGWDLATNGNKRGFHFNASPTLSDLYDKIDEVVYSLGYSQETTMEVRSALKTRINSLRIGGKGLMLDTRRSIPLATLLERPTVLELEHIGDNEEKAFLMGLILTTMYEYYVSRGITGEKDTRHVTVIEEAHRLLSSTAPENPYVANVKGKAVETFMNILSEIRAYGEGMLIAEQIPTRLAPDVIKNTNLKIMHRIVAEDDRKVMGATMNIEARELRKIASLDVGEAAVYGEGDTMAFHVKVPYSKMEEGAVSGRDDEVVRNAMGSLRKEAHLLAPYDLCQHYCKEICKYQAEGKIVSERQRFASRLSSLVISLVDDPGSAGAYLQEMLDVGREEEMRFESPEGLRICAAIHGAEQHFGWLGSGYAWPYDDTERLKIAFLGLYVRLLERCAGRDTTITASITDVSEAQPFANLYRDLARGKQPFPFCENICPEGYCIYRFSLAGAVYNADYHRRLQEIVNKGGPDAWTHLDALFREVARDVVLPGGNDKVIGRIALCFAQQKGYTINNFSRSDVRRMVEGLIGLTGENVQSSPSKKGPEGRE